jgi:hypothetical protein
MGSCDDDKSSQGPCPSLPSSENEDDAHAHAHAHDDHNTVDPQEEQQEAWATAEGYTPLADMSLLNMNNPYVMVSMGPTDSSDDDDDGHDEHEHGDDAPRGGAFFVNPSAFGNSLEDEDGDGDDVGNEVVCNEPPSTFPQQDDGDKVVVIDGFQSVADKALMALDDEYQRTLLGERRPPRLEEETNRSTTTTTTTAATTTTETKRAATTPAQQPHGSLESFAVLAVKVVEKEEDDDDLKRIIAAAFDERKEKKKEGTSSSFDVDWDTISSSTPPSSSSSSIAAAAAAAKLASVPVDTDAVRKAVQALSEKKDAPFQQKFALWQQRQPSSLPPKHHHDLIPQTSYRAFCRSTPKAKQATATLSRSATIAEALVRLEEQEESRMAATSTSTSTKNTLVIDVVGVDHVECKSVERIQTTFRPLVRWIGGSWKKRSGCEYSEVLLRLIGRDLIGDAEQQQQQPVNLLTPQTPTKLKTALATCHSGVYHEWLAQNDSQKSPDLIIAFNAGIWGYQEWEPTIDYLNHRDTATPVVITAYTLEECQEDWEVVQKTVTGGSSSSTGAKVLWEPEMNPFGSKVIRETKSSPSDNFENASWQAWSLGGGGDSVQQA